MKKEFNDLSLDKKKEYLFLQAISIDLPYVIALIPFIVLGIVTSSVYVGVASLIMIACLVTGFFIDMKKLNKVYGLN
jgi:hypothetical protein